MQSIAHCGSKASTYPQNGFTQNIYLAHPLQDIVPDRRISGRCPHFRFVSHDRDGDRGAGTRLTYTEQSAFLDGQDQPEGPEQGCKELLEALARKLERV